MKEHTSFHFPFFSHNFEEKIFCSPGFELIFSELKESKPTTKPPTMPPKIANSCSLKEFWTGLHQNYELGLSEFGHSFLIDDFSRQRPDFFLCRFLLGLDESVKRIIWNFTTLATIGNVIRRFFELCLNFLLKRHVLIGLNRHCKHAFWTTSIGWRLKHFHIVNVNIIRKLDSKVLNYSSFAGTKITVSMNIRFSRKIIELYCKD